MTDICKKDYKGYCFLRDFGFKCIYMEETDNNGKCQKKVHKKIQEISLLFPNKLLTTENARIILI